MIPRLQRFYGGSPGDWLDIPTWLLRCFSQMMPVLHARESIHTINELAFAFGGMEKEDGRKFVQELQRLASHDRVVVQARPRTMKEFMGTLGKSSTSVSTA